MRRSPIFTLTAVLTLALGIGANTAIFTVVNSVLLRPLPFHDPAHLLAIWDTYQPNFPKLGVSPTEYDEWSRQTDLFEAVGRYRYIASGQEANLTGGAEPLRIQASCASSSLFRMLGVHPILGRNFGAADDGPYSPRIALLSFNLWRDYFKADPQIIGKPIQLQSRAFIVAGVLPPNFKLLPWADLWLPEGQAGDEISNPLRHGFGVVARLQPGVSPRQAEARLDSISQRLAREHPKTSKGFGLTIRSLQEDLTGNLRPALLVLLGAVTFVLLIACVNVANLLLTRAASRRREIAIRIALGASRWRIVRDSLAESIQLSLMGGAAGLLVANAGLQALLRLAPAGLIDPASIHMDTTSLAFLAAVSILTGAIFGIAPALAAARLDPNDGLKESGRGLARGSSAGRNALVIVEFALALVLLMGAGLLIRSFALLVQVNPGFRTANLLTLRFEPSPVEPHSFYERLETRLRSLPGVEAVAATNSLPLTAERANVMRFIVPGSPLMRPDVFPVAQRHLITPDYFRTLGITLRGRTYNARDLDQPSVIINDTMAQSFWPGEDAIGKRFILGPSAVNPVWATVIGVAADVKQSGLDTERTNDFYFLDYGPRFLILKTASDPLLLATAVRREIQTLDPSAPVSEFRTMEQVLEASTGPRRFSTLLLSIFAGVALMLAVIGIYGILSWSVAQRTQEIGIRMAVGADAQEILKLILGRGLKLSAIGLVIGLAATMALTRFLSTQLFEISSHDPWVLTAVSALMLAVTTAACYIPAKRATKVDPITTLRA